MSKLPENEPDLGKKVKNIDSITAEQRYQGWVLMEFSNVIYRVLVWTYFDRIYLILKVLYLTKYRFLIIRI